MFRIWYHSSINTYKVQRFHQECFSSFCYFPFEFEYVVYFCPDSSFLLEMTLMNFAVLLNQKFVLSFTFYYICSKQFKIINFKNVSLNFHLKCGLNGNIVMTIEIDKQSKFWRSPRPWFPRKCEMRIKCLCIYNAHLAFRRSHLYTRLSFKLFSNESQ